MADNRLVTVDFINNTISKNSSYRGARLGSVVTEAQKQAIASGTFEDMYLGDYWEIQGIQWVIMDFNYWKNQQSVSRNHVVLMPRSALYSTKMNDTSSMETGYADSLMRTSGLIQARELIDTCFGLENVLSYREWLSTGILDDYVVTGRWETVQVELPSETMLYGFNMLSKRADVSNTARQAIASVSLQQLSLLRLQPEYRRSLPDNNYWLRDIVSGTRVVAISANTGRPGVAQPQVQYRVRPVFGLCGNTNE